MMTNQQTAEGLSPYLSPLSVWALAVGTSVGWGSLVVTSGTYLSKAGPVGTILGLLVGVAMMLVVCRNYHYMANAIPGTGGIYTYTKTVFGYDRAFLVSWFASLVYMAMLWANATSLPLFARYFFGDVFRFGYLYTFFGYDVYLGEALLTILAIALVALLCAKSKSATAHAMIAMAAVFIVGILVAFVAAVTGHAAAGGTFEPSFLPEPAPIRQVFRIAFISPWAFIGFEGVTLSTGEFNFKRKKIFRILSISVVTTTALYGCVTLLSIAAYPPEYDSWLAYIRDLGNLGGIEGLPAFYAARHYLGTAGVVLLGAALLCLVFTSLVGNIRALSRLFYTVAQDEILPRRFTALNRKRIPARAIFLVAAISVVAPFFGRVAVGWIVDVTTVGATLLYGFVSACAFKTAKKRGDRHETVTGAIGLFVMIALGLYLVLPDLFMTDNLDTETYFLFIVWSILGFLYFRGIIAKDHARRFGKAIIVWIALLSAVVLMSMIWVSRNKEAATEQAIDSIGAYYDGTASEEILAEDETSYVASVKQEMAQADMRGSMVMVALFALSLGVMLSNHFSMKKWEAKAANERDAAREVAYRDPLTGVKSKHAFVETEEKYDRAIETGGAPPFGVIVCDVNGLKHVNDTLGHQAGDAYIRAASELICDYFKHSPVFRVGGDEFVVILEGQDFERREELLRAVNEVIERHVGGDEVVVSLGCSTYRPGEDLEFHAVFDRADQRMYARKTELKSMGARVRE